MKQSKPAGEEPTKSEPESIIVSDKQGIKVWDINSLSGKPATEKAIGHTLKAKPYPHSKNVMFALTSSGTVMGYDMSAAEPSVLYKLENHDVLDFDHNPNKLHTLATGGKNASLQFWDTRKVGASPISVLLGHTHWITAVEYNHYYDQLVATGSSSTEIFLWRAIAQSSQTGGKSGIVTIYTEEDKEMAITQAELDDSVYCVKWSQQEPWIYGALGYSGQLQVLHVPYDEKYKIMI